jgi:hypothetical protein
VAITFIPPGRRVLANDNAPPWQDDVTLPGQWGSGQFSPGVGAPGILATPGVPPDLPPAANDNSPRLFTPGSSPPDDRFVASPPGGGSSTSGVLTPGGGAGGAGGPGVPGAITRSLLMRMAPWLGRVLGPAGAYFGSTGPAETGEFHPRVRPDIALGGKPTGVPFPVGPGYGQGPFAGRPDPGIGEGPFAGRPDPGTGQGPFAGRPDYGVGQGPFAGRPDPGSVGVGQGPFAGRPDVASAGVGQGPFAGRPAAAPVTRAPAVPPVRPKDAVAAQKPDLGYYNAQTNLDPLGRGGRRWGGPLDAPQSTAFDLSKLFQRQPQ